MVTGQRALVGLGLALLLASQGAAREVNPVAGDRRDLPHEKNSLGMTLVRLPAGKFMRGAKDDDNLRMAALEPRLEAKVDKPIWISAYEVTRGQFRKFVETTGYRTDAEKEGFSSFNHDASDERRDVIWRTPGIDQDDRHPVVCVSWFDAVNFCDWLSRMEGRRYRLPSDVEWAYACRAGGDTRFIWGHDPDEGMGWGNFGDSALKRRVANPHREWFNFDDGYAATAPVGSFRPNDWGLYDMLGNVCEWTESRVSLPNTPAKQLPRTYAVRGGAWDLPPRNCRVSSRGWASPADRFRFVGFRLVRDESQPGAKPAP